METVQRGRSCVGGPPEDTWLTDGGALELSGGEKANQKNNEIQSIHLCPFVNVISHTSKER